MVIRSSSALEIDRLVAQLRDGGPVARDAAVARLRVIGARALGRLAQLARSGAPDGARAAALTAIHGMDDRRARDLAVDLMQDDVPAVAVAAIEAARTWLATDTRVLDAVAALALDRSRDTAVRLAALDSLADLPRCVIQPMLQQLGAEPALRVPERARARDWLDNPAGVAEWLALRGRTAALSEIHDLIVRIRDREREEPAAVRRREWQAARAAAHQALAERRSRVALYDLREEFERADGPLPLAFLHAATAIGDAACLEPLGRAWAAARREAWWRDRVAAAARAIVAREKLTARHAAVRRVRIKYKGLLEA